jgi:hypothetical protein
MVTHDFVNKRVGVWADLPVSAILMVAIKIPWQFEILIIMSRELLTCDGGRCI